MSLNKLYTFSSFLSNNKSSVNPSFYINPPIVCIDSFLVSSFTGINNIYTFDSRNQNISILENGRTFTAIIPTGNYTITTLLTTLGSILTTASGTSTYTATNNSLTNVITITSNLNTFTLVNTVNDCYYELGFLKRSTTSTLTQVALNQYDLSGIKTINVISNDLGNDGAFSVNSNFNIICSIPIEVPYLGIISYQNKSNLLINCKVNELSSVSFILIDDRLRQLNNFSDFSLQLIASFE